MSDHKERLSALEAQQSFIVEAPAGSGKTELLSQRFLVLLSEAVSQPEGIVALTFTRKAAADMRERIIKALDDASDNTPCESEHQKVTRQLAENVLKKDTVNDWKLLENPNRLRIQTLDALASDLVRQIPMSSPLSPQFTVHEKPRQLYRQAAREILHHIDEHTDYRKAVHRILLHCDNQWEFTENLFATMLQSREQWLNTVVRAGDPSQLRRLLEQHLASIREELQNALKQSIPEDSHKELQELAEFSAKHLNRNEQKTCNQNAEEHSFEYWQGITKLLLTKEAQFRKTVTKANGFPAPSQSKDKTEKAHYRLMKTRMLALLELLATDENAYDDFHGHLKDCLHAPPAHYEDTQWEILESLLKVLPLLTAHLKLIFQEQGVSDFNEIASTALHALGDIEKPSDLALRLDYQIKHLLVDEFQDTSLAQFRLLQLLTQSWQNDGTHTLFLVGDPMQSIYRFRQAEVGLFLRVQEQGLGHIHCTPLRLSQNFRSTNKVVDWVNEQFSEAFPDESAMNTGAVSFNASTATNHSETGGVFIHPIYHRVSQEADEILSVVQQSQSENPSQSIAILVRARHHLIDILLRLQQAGLAYQAIEIDSLATQPLVQDLWALTRALLQPADRIAWLALLRAPYCGLNLSDIHCLANDKNNLILETLLDFKNNAGLSPFAKTRLSQIVPILNNALQERGRLSLENWVESCWLSLGGPACMKTDSDSDDANTFFQLLARLNRAGDCHQLDLKDDLLTLYASPTISADCTIQVMTIHKAKGLEFDTVILPSLHRKSPPGDTPLLMSMERIGEQGENQFLLAPVKSKSEQVDPLFQYVRREDKKKGFYESARLLYVACTRAKYHLHLFAAIPLDAEDDCGKPWKSSLLHHLWPTLERYFSKALSDQIKLKLRQRFRENDNDIRWQPYRRLSLNWKSPFKETINSEDAFQNPSAKDAWQQPSAKYFGLLVHRLLQLIAEKGLSAWKALDKDKKEQISYHYETSLSPHNNEKKYKEALIIIENVINDETGRWILSADNDAHAEWAIRYFEEIQLKQIIIDRSFIDEQGRRWIIDYKTHRTSLSNDPEKLKQVIQGHQAQLENYAAILSKMENRPIVLGLYFPVELIWHTWEINQ